MMASCNTGEIEGLALSYEELAAIPDNVVEEMLNAEAKIVIAAHKKSIRTLGLYKSGILEGSIEALNKSSREENGNRRYVTVYPMGTHHKYNGIQKRKVFSRSKHNTIHVYGGGTKTASSGEVGFIHEFGAPGRNIKATNWMKKANDSCAGEAVAAAMSIYDAWLKSINL
ncbi:MAG: hypothetical protein RR394_05310 [Oscillospiraceae bacterium]